VQKIVQATVALHNYLVQTDTAYYCPAGFVDSFDGSGNSPPEEWCRITSADEGSGAFCSVPIGVLAFFARGGGEPFAQNILTSCPNCYETVLTVAYI